MRQRARTPPPMACGEADRKASPMGVSNALVEALARFRQSRFERPGAIACRVYLTCALIVPISGKPEIGCAPFFFRRKEKGVGVVRAVKERACGALAV